MASLPPILAFDLKVNMNLPLMLFGLFLSELLRWHGSTVLVKWQKLT